MTEFDKNIQQILDSMHDVEVSVKELKHQKSIIEAEILQYSNYIGELKYEILDIMSKQGVKSTETEFCRVTRKAKPKKVLITDKKLIPCEYMRITKVPNLPLIKKGLEQGVNIQGVELNENSETIQVRTKS